MDNRYNKNYYYKNRTRILARQREKRLNETNEQKIDKKIYHMLYWEFITKPTIDVKKKKSNNTISVFDIKNENITLNFN